MLTIKGPLTPLLQNAEESYQMADILFFIGRIREHWVALLSFLLFLTFRKSYQTFSYAFFLLRGLNIISTSLKSIVQSFSSQFYFHVLLLCIFGICSVIFYFLFLCFFFFSFLQSFEKLERANIVCLFYMPRVIVRESKHWLNFSAGVCSLLDFSLNVINAHRAKKKINPEQTVMQL